MAKKGRRPPPKSLSVGRQQVFATREQTIYVTMVGVLTLALSVLNFWWTNHTASRTESHVDQRIVQQISLETPRQALGVQYPPNSMVPIKIVNRSGYPFGPVTSYVVFENPVRLAGSQPVNERTKRCWAQLDNVETAAGETLTLNHVHFVGSSSKVVQIALELQMLDGSWWIKSGVPREVRQAPDAIFPIKIPDNKYDTHVDDICAELLEKLGLPSDR
jgi:hypothetical protein